MEHANHDRAGRKRLPRAYRAIIGSLSGRAVERHQKQARLFSGRKSLGTQRTERAGVAKGIFQLAEGDIVIGQFNQEQSGAHVLQQTQLDSADEHICRHEIMAFGFYLVAEHTCAAYLTLFKESSLEPEDTSFRNVG